MARCTWIGFAAAVTFAMSLHAQSSVTGRVGVSIVHASETLSASPFAVSNLKATQGAARLRTDGSLAVDGPVGKGVTSQAATLVFKGAPRETIAIVLPARAELRSAEGHVLVAKAFTSSLPTGALDRQGERRINLGTSFDVAPDQRPGTYVGHTDILVAYN